MKQIKTLYIDGSRIKSGGGIQHLQEILRSNKLSYFDEIIIFSYSELELKLKDTNDKIIFRTNYLINKNILTCLFWQLFFLKREMKNINSILLSLDSTTLCKYKKNIIINQDIIGFQEKSLQFFKGKSLIYNYFKYLVASRAIKNSFANIFTTHFAKSLFKNINSENNIVIPHGVDSNILPKVKYNLTENSFFDIVFISPILAYKNHSYIIESLKKIAVEYNFKIHFVGGGNKIQVKKIKKEIEKNELNNHIILYPFLKHNEVLKLIINSDIAFFTSSVECFGITLLEYMRSAMPIICSNTSSLPETLKNTGIYVDLNKTSDLKEAVKLLFFDNELREKYGKLAYKESLKYSWEFTSNKTVEFIIKNYEKANMY
jgi:glycosyltransferase involved in cell wall biosynthesis